MLRLLFLSISFLGVQWLYGQLQTPPASPPTTIQTQIGLTETEIVYHRPGVKGRVIFGELIPYGEVWRTGANDATQIRFSEAVQLDTFSIPAGTYALFTIPDKEKWTVILSTQTELWGARGYDASQDVALIIVDAQQLPERIESMELRWMNISHNTADLALEWERTRIRIPFHFNTNQQVQTRIEHTLKGSPSARDYYYAARYHMDNNLDLAQAKKWMDRWFELEGEQFGIMRYQALLEKRLGNEEEAQRIMKRSLELARERPNPHYVRMNEQTLREWAAQPYTLSGAEVIDKSIAYHDPDHRWAVGTFPFRLHESRPGGGYRISDIVLSEGREYFFSDQIRDTDHIVRYTTADSCGITLNGSRDISTADQKRLRLTCEFNEIYRDYYTYLWGMPMKLRDSGTLVDEATQIVDFFSEQLIEVRVTYTEEVGDDIWYFYFSPDNYALRGYRFYHDEAANDGEYILLEGESVVNSLKIPAKRHWYTHGNRRYLGTDSVLSW